jgi:hypothetical protein
MRDEKVKLILLKQENALKTPRYIGGRGEIQVQYTKTNRKVFV